MAGSASLNAGPTAPRVAEFFAGMGLVRLAVEEAGFQVAFANDLDESKRALYEDNFGDGEFLCRDVRKVHAADIPDVAVATASFPCTDLSLAGNRAGLDGDESSMYWEFARVLRELDEDGRLPSVALLENVPSWATSNGGSDLLAAIAELNDLGYWCDMLVVNAQRFVPQSRPRLFVVCSTEPLAEPSDWTTSDVRPAWMERFVEAHADLRMQALGITPPPSLARTLADVVEKLDPTDERWWDVTRLGWFLASLSPLQAERLDARLCADDLSWATAYRRTRGGKPVWEIRKDSISGCLRTARGGSSKQALVEVGAGAVRARWMTAREYARLQGVGDDYRLGAVTENKALFALGDAVCVPVVAWLARSYLRRLVNGELTAREGVALTASGG